jgi:two-component system, chemotaxis family, CheB/CheR fusion protein
MARPRTKKPSKVSPSSSDAPSSAGRDEGRSFPIVGIGASAGGLDALEQFFRRLPSPNGMAFVVVQHLDPTRKGMMVELLQRSTTMTVLQARERQKVEPEHIYVIPPNKDLHILRGVLHLLAPIAPRGLRLPIDVFFRSLADDQQGRSIGVILSGMGSDGTLGLGAVKEKGGAVFVQDPASSAFDAMPRSVIDAGLADVVAPVEELPDRLVAYLAHAPPIARPERALAGKTQSAIERICIVLRSRTGHDFSLYKRSAVYRRIERRMGLHQIDGIATYVRYLQESPQEAMLLFKELLIGVTGFFRDPAAWDQLGAKAIPALLSERSGTMRAWVPACSTGEEAYSLAIAFKEAAEQARPTRSVSLQVFATDLDKDAIEVARQGFYRANVSSDISPERLQRYFVEEANGYRVSHEIRETVIFAPQNVIMDPPFTKLDILSCRNLLIYLAPDLQRKLLPLFHYALNPGGLLFLGSAETIGPATDLFSPVNGAARIYRRVETPPRTMPVEFPASFHSTPSASEKARMAQAQVPNLQALAERVLLERYSPAAVLTNDQGDILFINGRTGKYLEPAAGKANWNIHAMARAGLQYELSSAIQKASREHKTVTLPSVRLEIDGGALMVKVTIEPLLEPAALRGLMAIVFADAAPAVAGTAQDAAAKAPEAIARLEQELRQSREELQTTREEMQTSQEELRSANEELQSTNEELQSANEELTTSREEMQSMNEELQTLNHELQAKVEDLSRANDDMRNLLDSTDIATLFLDDKLKVRRFTSQTTKIINLIPSDVDRPITDLASDLVYPELAADARAVLHTLVFKETQVHTVNGQWFTVRIMPYRAMNNRIDGVVITFIDITVAKKLEATLRQQYADPRGGT